MFHAELYANHPQWDMFEIFFQSVLKKSWFCGFCALILLHSYFFISFHFNMLLIYLSLLGTPLNFTKGNNTPSLFPLALAFTSNSEHKWLAVPKRAIKREFIPTSVIKIFYFLHPSPDSQCILAVRWPPLNQT